jgi:hypothetical protein
MDGYLPYFTILEIDHSSIMLETLTLIIDSVNRPAWLKDSTGPNFLFYYIKSEISEQL